MEMLQEIDQLNNELYNMIYSKSNIKNRYSEIRNNDIVKIMIEKQDIEYFEKIVVKFNDKFKTENDFTILLNKIYEKVIQNLVLSIKNNDEEELNKNLKQNFLYLVPQKREEIEEKIGEFKIKIKNANLKLEDETIKKDQKFLNFYKNFLENTYTELYKSVPEHKNEIFFINYLNEIIEKAKKENNINNLKDVLIKDEECKNKFLKSIINKNCEKLFLNNCLDYLTNDTFLDKENPITLLANLILNKVYDSDYSSNLNHSENNGFVEKSFKFIKSFFKQDNEDNEDFYEKLNKRIKEFLEESKNKNNHFDLQKTIAFLFRINKEIENEKYKVSFSKKITLEKNAIDFFIKKVLENDGGEFFKKLQNFVQNGDFNFNYPIEKTFLEKVEKEFSLFVLFKFLLETQKFENNFKNSNYLNVFNYLDIFPVIKEKIVEDVNVRERTIFNLAYGNVLRLDNFKNFIKQQNNFLNDIGENFVLKNKEEIMGLKNILKNNNQYFKNFLINLLEMTNLSEKEMFNFRKLKDERKKNPYFDYLKETEFDNYLTNINLSKMKIYNKNTLDNFMSCYSKLVIFNYIIEKFEENNIHDVKNINISSLMGYIKENKDLKEIHDEFAKIKLNECVINKQDFKNLIENFDKKNENFNLDIVTQQLTSRLIVEDCIPKMECEKEIIKFSEFIILCNFDEEKIRESLEKLKYGYSLSDLVKEEENKKQKEERNNEYGAYDHLFYSQINNVERNEETSKSLEEKIESRMSDLSSQTQSTYNSYSYGSSSSSYSDSSSSSD